MLPNATRMATGLLRKHSGRGRYPAGRLAKANCGEPVETDTVPISHRPNTRCRNDARPCVNQEKSQDMARK